MFWFRTFAFGFLGSLLVLLLMPRDHRSPCAATMPAPAVRVPAPQVAANVTVVDVAPGVSGDALAQMIVLAANERIIAVDDTPVDSGVAALATHALAPHSYIDVTIGDDLGRTRRALVLLR